MVYNSSFQVQHHFNQVYQLSEPDIHKLEIKKKLLRRSIITYPIDTQFYLIVEIQALNYTYYIEFKVS